jgi:hypothetical protein
MAFRHVHIRPNLPLWRSVLSRESEVLYTYSVTSCDFVGGGAWASLRRATRCIAPMGLDLAARAEMSQLVESRVR